MVGKMNRVWKVAVAGAISAFWICFTVAVELFGSAAIGVAGEELSR